MDRLLIAAAHKSSGKTTVSTGLAAALRARGRAVQPFKKGPDYIDPMWLSAATGRACLNLDMHLMDEAAIARVFAQGVAGADLALVEGNHGLFDGLSLDGRDSNAALAHRLAMPVLLVIDVQGMTRGIAPVLLGYRAFDPGLRIGGVILNRVGGARHESKLRAVIEHYTDVPVLGAVHQDPALGLVERHLGLPTCAETDDARARIATIAGRVAEQVDIDGILALAASAGPLAARSPTITATMPGAGTPPVRIGVARDRAFCFYYPDDLQALERAGAELVFFDTLRDPVLPAVDGLFIGGGFPETCADQLEANATMRASIRAAIESGLPAYAECGGLMYLSRGLQWRGSRAEMVGVLPGEAVMHARPVGRGYVELEATDRMPWPGLRGRTVRAHEFHHSSLEDLPSDSRFAWRVRRGHGIDGRHDGLLLHRLTASYAHLRDAAGAGWASEFVAQVRTHVHGLESPDLVTDDLPSQEMPSCSA